MAGSEDARKAADKKACTILLEDHGVKTVEAPENWVFTYTPKSRMRGGGFEITVSKKTGEVIKVVNFQ